MSSQRQTLAVTLAAAAGSLLAASRTFAIAPEAGAGAPRVAAAAARRAEVRGSAGALAAQAPPGLPQAALGLAAGAVAAAAGARRSKRSAKSAGVARAATEYAHGEDLSVPEDAFCVLGVAHCFEQVEGKLKDVWVLEPVAASSVEVVNNGAETSYEAYIGVTVGTILAQDASVLPQELMCGHEVSWGSDLEFRTGCAARTWMRDHARDVVRKLVPEGEVQTGFNTSTRNKRILNFVNEVKDSDNIKQDMSIDVYGREGEEEEGKEGVEAQIAELYDV